MAPAPDKDTPGSDPCKYSHPLTAFTRFIDDQISNVLQSTIGLPSSKEDIRTWQWWRNLEDENHRTQSFGTRQEQENSQRNASDWVLSSPDSRNFSPQAQTISSALSDLSHSLHHLQASSLPLIFEDMALSVNILRGNKEACQDLKNYLEKSPYSPRRLEADPTLESSSILWRSAFADLICGAQGEDDSPRDYARERMDAPDTSSSFWQVLLLEKFRDQDLKLRKMRESPSAESTAFFARLSDYMKPAQDKNDKQPADQADNGSEQDVYDMCNQLKKDNTQQSVPLVQGTRTVTEQMTLVQEVVLPDGTVQRKRVLRMGFSDGTSETQTSNEVVKPAASAEPKVSKETTTDARKKVEGVKDSPQVKKGGWFWS